MPARCYCSTYDMMFKLLSVKAEPLEVSRKRGAGAGRAG